MGDTESFIQGAWTFSEPHLANLPGEQSLTMIWGFDVGTYSYAACCFNQDIQVTGRYRLVDIQDDSLTIDLYDSRGSETRFNARVKIKLNREDNTLIIQGTGPFTRVLP